MQQTQHRRAERAKPAAQQTAIHSPINPPVFNPNIDNSVIDPGHNQAEADHIAPQAAPLKDCAETVLQGCQGSMTSSC